MELWNDIYKKDEFTMKEPSESLVRFFGRISERLVDKKALDLGCGNGRNTFYMQKIGLDVWGIDISIEAINRAQELRQSSIYSPCFTTYDGSKLPFPDNSFSYVISHGVLDHIYFHQAKELMSEIHRALRPDGWCFLEVHSTYDSKIGEGELIEGNTYLIKEGFEKGLIQHFFDEGDLLEMTEGFFTKKLILNEETIMNEKRTSFWVLYLRCVK